MIWNSIAVIKENSIEHCDNQLKHLKEFTAK